MELEPSEQVFGVILALAGLVVTFYILIVKRKGTKWGLNSKRVNCPECGEQMPIVRRPKNFRQIMWGGGNCPGCGTEIDKWGNRI